VVVAYIVSVGGPQTRVYSAVNDFSRELHELLGMSVFAPTMARVRWRTIFPSPTSPEMPAWMEIGAKQAQPSFSDALRQITDPGGIRSRLERLAYSSSLRIMATRCEMFQAARSTQIEICRPISTTASGGRRKKSLT
jgi:hypothetical protein